MKCNLCIFWFFMHSKTSSGGGRKGKEKEGAPVEEGGNEREEGGPVEEGGKERKGREGREGKGRKGREGAPVGKEREGGSTCRGGRKGGGRKGKGRRREERKGGSTCRGSLASVAAASWRGG
jgi:hypothetical protein